MLKHWSLFIIFVIFLGASPAYSQLLFYDDCENKWLLNTDWTESNTTQGSNSLTLSSEYARAGSHSYKFYLQAFDANNIAATNCGLTLRGLNSPIQIKNFLYDTVYWMGFSIYIPSNYAWPSNSNRLADGQGEWQLLWQFHGIQDPCDTPSLNPNVAGLLDNYVSSPGYSIAISGDNRGCITKDYVRNTGYSTPSLKRGAWHDVVLNIRFSYNSTGFFKMWLDGKQVINDSGMNCYNQSKGPYFVIGPYGHKKGATIVYYDEIRVGDKNSSYAEVAPKGSPPPSSGTDSLEPPMLQVIPGN